eukprot:COSAG01_NODE_1444_length_10282_cov_17.103506_2_plen_565_part_00
METARQERVDAAQLARLWELLDPDSTGAVGWFAFLRGMEVVLEKEPALAELLAFDTPNRWALLSLLIDSPVCAMAERQIVANLTAVERAGIRFLERMQTKRSVDDGQMRALLRRACQGDLRRLNPQQQANISRIRWQVQLWMVLIAIVCNSICAFWENWLSYYYLTDGMGSDIYLACNNCTGGILDCQRALSFWATDDELTNMTCGSSPLYRTILWWVLDVPILVLTVVAEIYLLGFAALRATMLIAAEHDFRLVPLNQPRSFLALAFIRATFEMGNPSSPLLGVDPVAKSNLQKKVEAFAVTVVYALKVFILGTLIKLLLWQPFLSTVLYTWLNTHAPTVASLFWDCLICVVIMDEVELRATGVASGAELFNSLLDDFAADASAMQPSKHCKLQIVRAIGVAIVEQGTMYPPMELLLRHAIQYFDLSAEACRAGDLDSAAVLKQEMVSLPLPEQQLVAHVYLLAVLLDGNFTSSEVAAFEELFVAQHVGTGFGEELTSTPQWIERSALKTRLLELGYRYRNRAEFITAADLRAALDAKGWEGRGWSLHRTSETMWNYATWSLV